MNWLKSFGFNQSDDSSQKGVNELRTHWGHIRGYFRDCHQDPNSMAKMKSQLPDVENKLGRIVLLLSQERRDFALALHSSTSMLPPCFDYIIRGARTGIAEDGTTIQLGVEVEGQQLVTTVCQYAKLDMPEGSRALMLRFLARLFREADVNTGTKSLLHFNNDNIAVPLFDCLSKVSAQVDPWRANALTANKGVPQKPSKSLQRDRREFVFLMESLCSQVAFIPSLSSFFLMKQVTGKHLDSNVVVGATPEKPRAPTNNEEGPVAPPKGGLLLLIEGVLPFLQDRVEDLTHHDRISTTRAAMRALLNIARVSDPVVQGFLLYDDRVPQLIIRELCSAMVTACKVPDFTEYPLHVAHIVDTISFIDSVLLTNPQLGQSWKLLETHFVRNLLEGTVRTLVRGDDDVYGRVLSVLGFVLQQGTLKSEQLRQAFATFLLGTPEEGGDGLAPSSGLFRSIIIPRINHTNARVAEVTLQFTQAFVENYPLETLERILGLGEFEISAEGPVQPVSLVPRLNVSSCFPESLQKHDACGTKGQAFMDDVLKRLLRIEGYVPCLDALHRHQPSVLSTSAPGPQHPYFDRGVNESDLVLALTTRIHGLPETTAEINLALTGVVTALVLLPDYRVCYTLLDDSNGGVVARAIKAVSSMIEEEVQEDRERCRAINREAGGSVTTSRLTLYKHYVQRTGFFVGGDVYQEVVQSFHSMQGSQSMEYMVSHHMDPQAAAPSPNSPEDNEKERVFVECCVVLEGLRHELFTAVGQVEMSLHLMELAV